MTTARDSGTVQWMAPERLAPETEGRRLTFSADVYAFGCLCYMVSMLRFLFHRSADSHKRQMFTHKQPFSHIKSEYAIIVQVLGGHRPTKPSANECRGTPPAEHQWALIKRCWAHNPTDRPTMTNVTVHFETPLLSENRAPKLNAVRATDQPSISAPPVRVNEHLAVLLPRDLWQVRCNGDCLSGILTDCSI